MAQLNPSNVVNGNIVEANDILQLYDALTAGGGTTGAYDISISGSLTGSATSASFAISSSSAVTSSYSLTSLSASFSISSSRTVTASFALTANNVVSSSYSITSDLTNVLISPSGSNFSTDVQAIAVGSVFTTSSLAAVTASFLTGRTLGSNVFITTTVIGQPLPSCVRSFNPAIGGIQFQTSGGTGNELLMYTIIYRPS